jgi:hypothetical protein
MKFHKANDAYEAWLHSQCDVVEDDLQHKHKRMKHNAFVFLRATFFRWASTIEVLCPELAGAPAVLSIGDAHVENFGTWRDIEGRLVWGANDFDEAALIAYPFDLVRLATSVQLAPDLAVDRADCCNAILDSYREGIAAPLPFVLDEHHAWLRTRVVCLDDKRAKFWDEINELPRAVPPEAVRVALVSALPSGAQRVRFAARSAGGGSLGRPRYVAIADWRGGNVLREAKALVPSGWDWAHDNPDATSRFLDLALATTRAPDPYMTVVAGFIIRRLAADSHKAELGDHPGSQLQAKLLHAMGRELGALHAVTADVAAVLKDLHERDADWLESASEVAGEAVKADFADWASAD